MFSRLTSNVPPPNLTDQFQPLDLNVNGFAKQFLKSKFKSSYANEVTKEIDSGKNVYNVDIKSR